MTRFENRDNLKRSRHGVWIWRKVHPLTGQRKWRSTGTKIRKRARQVAAGFEDEFERLRLGMPVVTRHDPRLALEPLIPAYLTAVGVGVRTERWLREKDRNLREGLDVMRIRAAADLEDLERLSTLLKNSGAEGRQRRLQDELRRFVTWLSENKRHLPEDKLARWARVKVPRNPAVAPRALSPEEAARTFEAIEVLDGLYRRKVSQKIPILLLLVSGPRIGALCERDVRHLDRPGQRIEYGADVGTKRRGAGALDARTFAELATYVGDRDSGPLCLAPGGGRLDTGNLRKDFSEAHGLGSVRSLWPKDVAFDWTLASLVERYLTTGKVPGQPGRPSDKRRQERAALKERVLGIAGPIGEAWRAIVFKPCGKRVNPHELRDTAETWCRDLGVPSAAIDRQLGHAETGGSATGRRFYYDARLNAPEFEDVTGARLVPARIREVLDVALKRLVDERRG
ncbi:MAG: hypothetical protein JKY65_33250 [Planctomycetes bacterium]|nr:hypothetical protein [Planctomycetota bacterium]